MVWKTIMLGWYVRALLTCHDFFHKLRHDWVRTSTHSITRIPGPTTIHYSHHHHRHTCTPLTLWEVVCVRVLLTPCPFQQNEVTIWLGTSVMLGCNGYWFLKGVTGVLRNV